jgi:hypothetical protein
MTCSLFLKLKLAQVEDLVLFVVMSMKKKVQKFQRFTVVDKSPEHHSLAAI